jgi:NAD(P)-dependent dehydrogenase (short-subunit alcohol dehydrogenase family)
MRALVTGAARGLGLEIVREGVKRGHQIAASVRPESVSEALTALAESHPDRITVFRMDVASGRQAAEVAARLTASWGALDALVNNAAILIGRYESIEALNLDDVRRTFEVNVLGVMNVVQQCLPLLFLGEKPVVINVSSEAGTIVNAFPANYPYAISKTAVNMFTERLRAHLSDRDIHAWAIHPGWMRTAMGGGDAPVDPAVTAWGFWEILERKTVITSKIAFIDATGRPMPL